MGTKQYNSATDLITFSRTSSATFLGSNGLLQTAAANTPRIDYDYNGTVKGLLIEEQRTNLRENSVDLSVAGFLAGGAVLTGSQPDPNGGSTGFVLSALDGTSKYRGISATGSVAAGDSITGSIWIKGVAGETTHMRLVRNGSGTLEFTTKLITLTGDWQRESVTHTFTNPQEHSRLDVGRITSGATAQSISLAWCQVEAGSFPTSYIPTTGSTATRSADVATIPTSAFGYNQDEGTLVVEFEADSWAQNANTQSFSKVWEFTGNTGSNADGIFRDPATGDGDYLRYRFNESDATTAALGPANLDPVSGVNKVAVALGQGDAAIVMNGGTPATGSGTAAMDKYADILLGRSVNNNNFLNGHIRDFQYYPRRLTNAQLQELTT